MRTFFLSIFTALFTVSVAFGLDPQTTAEIDELIAFGKSSDVRFVRNGREYSGAEGAEHLRSKLGQAGDRLKTTDDFITADGWRVGFFTGDDKSGLDGFLRGDVDVLIGSSAIGTGVDGLQDVCERLIVNVLPWTNAEFEQLKGRIYRQGQRVAKVMVVLPLTFASVNGERWSWCESKMRQHESSSEPWCQKSPAPLDRTKVR